MINEWVEFCAYTGTVSYTASKKSDTTWLGRFTFATILEFEGMARILTILARGYLFHSKDGAVVSGDPHDRVDYVRRALCAWCSVPEDGKRVQDKEWQFQTDFSELLTEFPELVDTDGTGWFLRHVLRAADFMLTHPEKVSALRQAMREQAWHFMDEDARECFLREWLTEPEFEDVYDLLTDFRFGGYRILGDIVCDMEDENTGREKKQLFRESDLEAFTAMMRAFADKSASRSYRDAVTAKCRELLTAIVRPALAVRYVVALGRRDLLWELLPEYIEKNVLEVRDD